MNALMVAAMGLLLAVGTAGTGWGAGQDAPPPSPPPTEEVEPARPEASEPASPEVAETEQPGEAAPAQPKGEGREEADTVAGPTPGAPTIGLATAVALGLEHNRSLLSAADGVTAARTNEAVSRAAFYPKLTPSYARSEDTSTYGLEASQKLPWSGASVSASAAYTTEPSTSALPRTTDLRVSVTQPLLRGFGPTATHFELTNSRRARQSRERSFELSRQRLAVDVTRAFYRVVQQRQLLLVARDSLHRNQRLQAASEARLQVGRVSKLDVFRAQLQAAQAEESAVRAEAGLASALESFRVLLGLGPTDPLEPEAVRLPEDLVEEAEPLEALLARARERRLELAEARDLVDDARRSHSVARQNLLPRLDLGLTYLQRGSGPDFHSALDTADEQVLFSLTTSYPLERSQAAAQSALAELDRRGRERDLVQRELDVEGEVRSAHRELERIRKSVELQRRSVDVAQSQLRLSTLRYQRGLASNFDVVDAESSLVLARSTLVTLLTDYQVARAELARVTGTLDPGQEPAP